MKTNAPLGFTRIYLREQKQTCNYTSKIHINVAAICTYNVKEHGMRKKNVQHWLGLKKIVYDSLLSFM